MQHDQKLGFFLPRNVRLFIFKILINIIHHIIRIKWKNHMTDTVDTGKAVYKIQYLFIIKTLSILVIKENSVWCVCVLSQSCPTLCSPPGSSVHGFSRQEYWSGLPCLSPGDLPDPGIEPMSLESSALAGGFFTTIATKSPVPNTIHNDEILEFSP